MKEDLKEVADLLVHPNTIELGLKLLEDRFGFEVVLKSTGLDKWVKFWNGHKYSICLAAGGFIIRISHVDKDFLIKLYSYFRTIGIFKYCVYFDNH